MSAVKPRTKSPELEIETLDEGQWRLSDQKPENFTMIVAYRGLHCPICRTYLSELDRNAEEFGKRGVEVIAVSTDTLERAAQTKDEWKLRNLRIGYGLSIPKAREWGLYISSSRGKTSAGVVEPNQFNEPGVFLIKPDQTLYASSVATMPFARPHFKEVLAAIDFIVEKDYPARGEA
ncbi:MAG: AhpC/TSA family protein [Nitrospira sp.]|jgi:peroxiredoxin|nr:AhpC/TSA family protein [Nitrospira sp.]